jgi:subtilisin family serine protease
VQPNYQYQLQQGASAKPYGDPAQYALGKLRLAEAHGITKGDRILVAVIDSGIDASHPELAGVIADSLDTVDGGEPHTHGTGIAGTIAAHSRLMGVAPRAKVLAVRAFDPSGSGAQGTTFSILKGLEWSVGKGARVINMSFAGPKDPALGRAMSAAHKKGVALIAAAGNAGPKSPALYPAADPNVIAVSATDAEDKLFPDSNRGNHVAVSAPGVDILVPSPGAAYQVTSGTSFAAAHISGIAALVLERDPGLSPDGLRRVLLSTARDLGPKGRDKDFGVGLADAYRAVISAEGKPGDAISSNEAGSR